MKKFVLLLLVFFLFTAFKAFSQAKKVVAVMPFLSSVPENRQVAAALQSVALQVFSQNTTVTIVDRSSDAMVLKELDNQMREQSISSQTLAEQGKLSGSQEIIVGTLNTVSIEARGSKYIASLNYTLQVDDAATGVMISSKNIKGNTNNQDLGSKILSNRLLGGTANALGDASSLLMADTREQAVTNAIDYSKKQMAMWINSIYPPAVRIVAVDTRDGKGYPETLALAGFAPDVRTGKTVVVSEVTYIDNGSEPKTKRVIKIAELKIVEAQGQVTECKVKSGEDVLDEKIKSKSQLEFSIK